MGSVPDFLQSRPGLTGGPATVNGSVLNAPVLFKEIIIIWPTRPNIGSAGGGGGASYINIKLSRHEGRCGQYATYLQVVLFIFSRVRNEGGGGSGLS